MQQKRKMLVTNVGPIRRCQLQSPCTIVTSGFKRRPTRECRNQFEVCCYSMHKCYIYKFHSLFYYYFIIKETVYSSNIKVKIWCTVPDYSFKLIHICGPLIAQSGDTAHSQTVQSKTSIQSHRNKECIRRAVRNPHKHITNVYLSNKSKWDEASKSVSAQLSRILHDYMHVLC